MVFPENPRKTTRTEHNTYMFKASLRVEVTKLFGKCGSADPKSDSLVQVPELGRESIFERLRCM